MKLQTEISWLSFFMAHGVDRVNREPSCQLCTSEVISLERERLTDTQSTTEAVANGHGLK